MGDAEFAGGGSVSWEVKNSDGESGGGDKSKCKGKDKDPKGVDGSFAVTANGKLMFTLPATKGNVVKVLWGPDTSVTTSASPTTSARATASVAKKKTTKSRTR
jgi:hypothetical protein